MTPFEILKDPMNPFDTKMPINPQFYKAMKDSILELEARVIALERKKAKKGE